MIIQSRLKIAILSQGVSGHAMFIETAEKEGGFVTRRVVLGRTSAREERGNQPPWWDQQKQNLSVALEMLSSSRNSKYKLQPGDKDSGRIKTG